MVVGCFEIRGALWPPRTKGFGSRDRSFLPSMEGRGGHGC